MEKRGQFFLIAAIVIIGILASLTVVYNVVTTPKDNSGIYDLSNQISYEGAQTINSGVFSALSQAQIENNVQNITNYYHNINPNVNIYTVYGNETSVSILNYTCFSSSISLGPTAGITDCTSHYSNSHKMTPSNGEVKLNISGTEYSFRLHPGQNFYLLLKKKGSAGGNIVASNDKKTHPDA